jgi:hypothetical protein
MEPYKGIEITAKVNNSIVYITNLAATFSRKIYTNDRKVVIKIPMTM